jgi:hypothetical protein
MCNAAFTVALSINLIFYQKTEAKPEPFFFGEVGFGIELIFGPFVTNVALSVPSLAMPGYNEDFL